MKSTLKFGIVCVAFIVFAASLNHQPTTNSAMAQQQTNADNRPMLAHMVYFSLNDNTPENRRTVLDACQKHLTGHPGTIFYAAGTRAAQYNREVNDQDYDIALQLVFKDHAAHDTYQASPRHQEFIAACRGLWKKVRVFDSDVTGAEK